MMNQTVQVTTYQDHLLAIDHKKHSAIVEPGVQVQCHCEPE